MTVREEVVSGGPGAGAATGQPWWVGHHEPQHGSCGRFGRCLRRRRRSRARRDPRRAAVRVLLLAAALLFPEVGNEAYRTLFPQPPDPRATAIVPADRAGAHAGSTVALDGSVMLVGVPEDGPGSVRAFREVGLSWLPDGTLRPHGGAPGDRFGAALAISRDTAAVGAPRGAPPVQPGEPVDAAGPTIASGTVWVFDRSHGGWELGAVLPSPTGMPGDRFGEAVALDADLLAVAAPGAYDGDAIPGSVHLYERRGGDWQHLAEVRDPGIGEDTPGTRRFGHAVDVDGGRVAVGAPRLVALARPGPPSADREPADRQAAGVHVFRRSDDGWQLEQSLLSDSGGGNAPDEFGRALSMDGRVLAVGAPADDRAAVDAGAVHIFRQRRASVAGVDRSIDPAPDNGTGPPPTSAWEHTGVLVADDAHGGFRFGQSVAVAGDVLLVGAPLAGAGDIATGRVYAFVQTKERRLVRDDSSRPASAVADDAVGTPGRAAATGSRWLLVRKLDVGHTAGAQRFGESVALQGWTFAAGAPTAGKSGSGAVYVQRTRGIDAEIVVGRTSEDHLVRLRRRYADVGVLSRPGFPPHEAIDRSTIRLGSRGHASVEPVTCASRGRDLNHDGITDLYCFFSVRALRLDRLHGSPTGLVLKARTRAGLPVTARVVADLVGSR